MSKPEPKAKAPRADLADLQSRAAAIGAAAPFRSWPAPALLRLAGAASVAAHAPGALVVAKGPTNGVVTVIVDGTALACVTGPEGWRVTFKMAAGTTVHGLIPLVDGKEMANDVIALDPVRAVRIPHAALRAELQAAPVLWQSVAIDLAERARRYTEQMKRFVFDQPLVHLALLLTGMARSAGSIVPGQPIPIEARLSQEMLAEMLGISRQWASTLVRDLVADGVLSWRYGRVTVLDFERLRELSEQGIDSGAPPRPGRRAGPPPARDGAARPGRIGASG